MDLERLRSFDNDELGPRQALTPDWICGKKEKKKKKHFTNCRHPTFTVTADLRSVFRLETLHEVKQRRRSPVQAGDVVPMAAAGNEGGSDVAVLTTERRGGLVLLMHAGKTPTFVTGSVYLSPGLGLEDRKSFSPSFSPSTS